MNIFIQIHVMKKRLLSFFLFLPVVLLAQDKQAYQLYTKKGHKVSYKKFLRDVEQSEVILFGEYHNNAIAHWLELELAKDLSDKKKIVMGAEMLEADNQKQLDHYLKGEITQKQLDSTARLWPNYKTDYKPLVDFAKDKNIAFFATNVPRRYASLVSKKGFEALDSLSTAEKKWIAPLPIAFDSQLPGYVNMMKMMGEHASPNMPKAQALKDATMAYFITANLVPQSVFLHYNGSYHSDDFEGIYWYLHQANPGLKISTIATVEQTNIHQLMEENYTKADYILVIDEDVTKTY